MPTSGIVRVVSRARNWSLFVILPLMGFLLVFIVYPLKISLLEHPEVRSVFELYAHGRSKIFTKDPSLVIPIMMASVLAGISIQAISVVYWHWSACSVKDFFKYTFRGNCTIKSSSMDMKLLHHECERYKSTRPKVGRMAAIFLHLLTRVNAACRKELSSIRLRTSDVELEKEGRFPVAGTIEYARYQIFLEESLFRRICGASGEAERMF